MTPIRPTTLIDAKELVLLKAKTNIIVLDVSNGKEAKTNYANEHIEEAQFVDVNTQLAEIPDNFAKGGRHPLPSLEKFATVLTNLGITPESHVVLYDDKNGVNAAARLWWMLRSIGHPFVYVLDGGLQAAKKIGIPTNDALVIPPKVDSYPIKSWQLPMITLEEISTINHSKEHLIIDVRESKRYRGIEEPIDTIAGHIPGAINVPFATNLDTDGNFLSATELRRKYESVIQDIPISNVVVHCGSGVTACHTLLAFAHAGLEIPKLYVGSWSEWSRNKKKTL